MERLKALGYGQEDFVRPHSESLDLTHRWDKLVKRRQVLTEDGIIIFVLCYDAF